MCGITGFYNPNTAIETQKYYSAHLQIKHRGPDDEGFFALQGNEHSPCFLKGDDTVQELQGLNHIKTLSSSKLVLGHRRLSIIDLSFHGHQPIQFEHLYMTYNGEIFNYQELKNELQLAGYGFTTHTDTEVLLKAYHYWGNNVFNKLNGMWALAIYNAKDKTLILSRDRFGIKPLYYSIYNGTLVFSSEMKFIMSFTDRNYSINKASVSSYLRNAELTYSKKTMWNEIEELEPGHYLTYYHQGSQITKYWTFEPCIEKLSEHDAVEKFKTLFEDSLKLRMISDVKVGSLLSGGLDSTTIVCMLSNLGLVKAEDFQTFSAVFKEDRFSEKKYIDKTVSQTGVHPNFIYPEPEKLSSYIHKIHYHIEEPFCSLSMYSQFLIYESISTKTQVKVLLNGQGSDEVLNGYSYHYYPFFVGLLKQLKLQKLTKEFGLWKQHRVASTSTLLKQLALYFYKNIGCMHPLTNVSLSEIRHYPLREYLKYDDRISMAFGLEARVPFLDYRLVEFALNLQEKYKIDHFTNKRILRLYVKDQIPSEVISRKDKQGFVSPQEVWQRKELKREFDHVFNQIKQDGLPSVNNTKHFEKLYSDYQNGKNNSWTKIWRIYNLKKWADVWANGNISNPYE